MHQTIYIGTAVWPNWPIFEKFRSQIVLQKKPKYLETLKNVKKSRNIWATFVSEFVANAFQKLPNLVTLRYQSP